MQAYNNRPQSSKRITIEWRVSMWILIMLHLSSWDGGVTFQESLGSFSTYKDCVREIDRVGKIDRTRFICVQNTEAKETK